MQLIKVQSPSITHLTTSSEPLILQFQKNNCLRFYSLAPHLKLELNPSEEKLALNLFQFLTMILSQHISQRCMTISFSAYHFFVEGPSSMVDWLIIYDFTSRSRIHVFHLYGDVTNAGEGLQHLGLCSALRAFEQGGIFIVPHLLWHGTSVFPVSSKGPPHLVASYDTWGDVENLFYQSRSISY
jgi:hypothetical protein